MMKIEISEDRKVWVYPIIFIAFSLLIYWPSLYGDPFWDDWVFIFKAYRQQMHAASPLIFFPGGSESKSWPVFYTILWTMVKFFKDKYYLFHATNIFFHGLNGFLIWKLLKAVRVKNSFSWSLLFIAHPLHLFTVAWIFQSKTIFSLTFFLCSLLLLVKYFHKEHLKYYFSSLLFFILSLLTKSTTVGFAIPLFFSYRLFRKKMSFQKFALLFIGPVLIFSLLATLRTAWTYNIRDLYKKEKIVLLQPLPTNIKLKRIEVSNVTGAGERLLITIKLLGRYSKFLVLPIGGDHIFQEPSTLEYSNVEFLLLLVTLLGTYLLLKYFFQRKLYLEFLGLLFYLATILPFCGAFYLPIFSTTNFNPYWLSIPLLGLLPIGSHLIKSQNKIIFITLAAASLTHWQSYQFINTEDLFMDSIKKSPEQKIYQASLIEHYVNTHQCKKAREMFDQYAITSNVRLFSLDTKVNGCENFRKDQR